MCGITGIVDIVSQRDIGKPVLIAMNDRLSHRGPDGYGVHIEPGAGLAQRRLSIIDLAGGKQPIYNEDNTVVLTYNGEIYNYRELEEELREKGHQFRTRCDTEVVVHAWEEWGPACVERFNGMFAFGLWDQNTQTFFAARDRIGIKPLYYAVTDDGFLYFASELKSLFGVGTLEKGIDHGAVEEYFTFGYIPEPKSIDVGIKKLEPGCWIKVERGKKPLVQRYWDLYLDKDPDLGADDWRDALVENLEAAVKRRLVADVPLGAFLSGGIDSSAIVAMMKKIGANDILTCSIGFDEKRYDESAYASMVAEHLQTDHHSAQVAHGDFDLLDSLARIYDEPYADSSAMPTYRVCELARKHVTVALSGDGGDEDFLGYRRYGLFAMEERVRSSLPLGIRRPVFGALGNLYPKLDWAPRVFRGKTTFQALARTTSEAYLHGVSITSDDLRDKLFSGQMKSELQGYRSHGVFERVLEGKEFKDPMRMVQYLDFRTYLPGDILTKVDRASMAHSLEVRVPMLDHTFVEWAARLPTSVKRARGEAKYALKESLLPYLPREVLYRTKMGFAVPLDVWFRGPLKEKIAQAATGERLKDSGLFNPAMLDELVRDHHSGRRDYSGPLWSLLMFDRYLESRA